MNKYIGFKTYTNYLSSLVRQNQNKIQCRNKDDDIEAALNGECSNELRNTVSLEVRRNDGVFFTSSDLSEFAVANKLKNTSRNSVYCDLACGAGDLLIAASKCLKVEKTLEKTLESWGQKLIGRDINPLFINATRSRIALAAIQRGARTKSVRKLPLRELLSNIKVGNGLHFNDYEKVTHILLNPPFNMSEAKNGCLWSSGNVNSAAIFIDECTKNAKPGTRIIAILPDVLRSGARYKFWRKNIVDRASVNEIDLYGTFDNKADVDVFVLDAVTLNCTNTKYLKSFCQNKKISTVKEKFKVYVGPVVPFRNKGLGRWYPYIHAKNIEPWITYYEIEENVRFNGTVFKPPFVVIRRTSRYGDPHRAAATIIAGKKLVAVENHLLVCIPKNGKLSECRKLINHLKTKKVDKWLDQRIRCRHLTVGAIKDIPFNG